jgi:hypothetical protein
MYALFVVMIAEADVDYVPGDKAVPFERYLMQTPPEPKSTEGRQSKI